MSSARYLTRHRQEIVNRMLRVNHAGELGADRIYMGQIYGLGNCSTKVNQTVQEMWNEEKNHLKTFEKLLVERSAPKSLLTPFWNIGGLAIGVLSGKLGKKVAMATTVAIESVITEHYNEQIRTLMNDEKMRKENEELIKTLCKFRDDEQHHHDTGINNEAEQAIFYKIIKHSVQTLSKIAIKVAERV